MMPSLNRQTRPPLCPLSRKASIRVNATRAGSGRQQQFLLPDIANLRAKKDLGTHR
jgi:hypothetical protein